MDNCRRRFRHLFRRALEDTSRNTHRRPARRSWRRHGTPGVTLPGAICARAAIRCSTLHFLDAQLLPHPQQARIPNSRQVSRRLDVTPANSASVSKHSPSSMARPLLPHSTSPPTADALAQAEPAATQKHKRPKGVLAVACQACQKRKIKVSPPPSRTVRPLTRHSQCDGARPACRPCASKKVCIYDVPEGQTRIAALKSHAAQLQTRLSTSINLIRTLKTTPPDEAARILERIRSSPDPSHLLDQPNHDSTSSTSAPQNPTSPLSNHSPSVDTLHPSNEHRLSSSAFALLRSPATIEAFRFLLQCTGLLFHVFTRAQGEALLQEVQGNDDTAVSETSMCEACAMAALGFQYSQGETGFETGQYLYNVARQYLDDAIAADPLRAMKVCVLLAMYNIVKKSSVALVYVGMLPLSHVGIANFVPA